ncbi:hypothetical protein FHG87_007494 [Trinorchestia longiramus]|nr:hypothetical protein FHG87_007494 [Trinorchestia longiramus]
MSHRPRLEERRRLHTKPSRGKRITILTLDHSPDHSPDHIHDHIPDHILDHIFDHILDHYLAATVVEWYAARVLYRVSACAERLRAGSKPGNDTSYFSFHAVSSHLSISTTTTTSNVQPAIQPAPEPF